MQFEIQNQIDLRLCFIMASLTNFERVLTFVQFIALEKFFKKINILLFDDFAQLFLLENNVLYTLQVALKSLVILILPKHISIV